MSLSHLYKIVLGNLWTAGYRPSMRERIRMQHEVGAGHIGADANAIDDLAREKLIALGYEPIETGTGLRLLEMLADREGPRPDDASPLAGHVIECEGHWCGDLIRMSGYYNDPDYGLSIGNSKAGWVGHIERMHWSLSCGGPSAHAPISTGNLVRTGRTAFVVQWDFAMLPAAHSGVHWLTEVPVWEAETIIFDTNTKAAA